MSDDIFKCGDQEKFNILMNIHFPKIVEVEKLKCEICEDFKEKYCLGKKLTGLEVVECMLERVDNVEVEIHKSLIQ
jgi:hypothetical protein